MNSSASQSLFNLFFRFWTRTFDTQTSLVGWLKLKFWSGGRQQQQKQQQQQQQRSLVCIILMCSWSLKVKVFSTPQLFHVNSALPESVLISLEVRRPLRVVCFTVYFTRWHQTLDIRPVQGRCDVVLELEGLNKATENLMNFRLKYRFPTIS